VTCKDVRTWASPNASLSRLLGLEARKPSHRLRVSFYFVLHLLPE
jgi:hypothetical protein